MYHYGLRYNCQSSGHPWTCSDSILLYCPKIIFPIDHHYETDCCKTSQTANKANYDSFCLMMSDIIKSFSKAGACGLGQWEKYCLCIQQATYPANPEARKLLWCMLQVTYYNWMDWAALFGSLSSSIIPLWYCQGTVLSACARGCTSKSTEIMQ